MFGLFHFARAKFPQVPIARTAKSALYNYLTANETDLNGMDRVRERVKRTDRMLQHLAERGIYRHPTKPVYVPTHIAVDFITESEQATGQKPFTPLRNFVKAEGALTLKPDGDIGFERFGRYVVPDLRFAPDTQHFYYKETGAPMPEETKPGLEMPKMRLTFTALFPKQGENYEEFRKKIDEAARKRIDAAFDRWANMPTDKFYSATANAIDLLRKKVGCTVLKNTPDHLVETVAEALERLIDLEAAARCGKAGAAQAQKYVGEYGLDIDMIRRETEICKQAAEMAETGKREREEAAEKARRTYEANARAEYLTAIGKLDMARRKLRKIGRRPDISIDSSAGHVHCAGFLSEEAK